MADVIDTKGLTDENVKLVREFVDFLKEKAQKPGPEEGKDKVSFHVWPLGVKGKLTREEIYDYL